jgi:hypothetical protein
MDESYFFERIKALGVFVAMDGYSRQSLLHSSQVSGFIGGGILTKVGTCSYYE